MTDVQSIEKQGDAYILNTGSPHYVRFVEALENLDIVADGRAVRYSERWKKDGINVNFVSTIQKLGSKKTYPAPDTGEEGANLAIRTYERGVEDETFACGTGVTAAAIASFLQAGGTAAQVEVPVHAKGGDLAVRFQANGDGTFTNIWLCGPAVRVFQGEIQTKA